MKTKMLVLLGAAALLALPMSALAKVGGVCSDCHTMHNSKAGATMALTDSGAASVTPNAVLLIGSCVGCHASGGTDPIETWGTSSVPQVNHSGADLAGGNFAYISGLKGGAASDRKGHNVIDMLTADATLTGPPGMGRGATSSSMHTGSAAVPNTTFTCAGNDGCHGTRNGLISAAVAASTDYVAGTAAVIDDPLTLTIDETADAIPQVGTAAVAGVKKTGLNAIKGAHHNNASGTIDGTTFDALKDGNSYRFLRGVYGVEDADWENTKDAADHNGYFGTNGSPFGTGCNDCHDPINHGSAIDASMQAPSNSISGFCATCHGTFHADTDANGSFIRHPTDYALPGTSEYAAYTVYDPSVPVARTDLTTAPGTVTPGNGQDLVSCLSCHVAHGSANEGMLRFDYAGMVADGGANTTGCFVCHTTKDTGGL